MGNNKNANYGDDSEYFKRAFLDTKEIVESDSRYIAAFNKRENFGAYVGDPSLNDYCGVKDSAGHKSKFLFANVFDEDFSSLYPSIIRAYNLDKNTQVGKFFLIDNEIKQNLIEKYGYGDLFAVSKNEEGNADADASSSDLGPTLVDSLVSHNWSRIGEKYFNLPSTTDLIKNLKSSFLKNN